MDAELLTATSILLDQPERRLAAAWERAESGAGYERIVATRGGKQRELHVPDALLAGVQRQVLRRLLYGGPVSAAAYGGVPGRSFTAAAREHLRRLDGPLGGQAASFLAIDVVDAFHATTEAKVRAALRQRLRPELRVLGISRRSARELAQELARLLTVPRSHGTRCLPLGAPTSLATFNLVCLPLDREVFALLQGLPGEPVYTRYVDDLVVSSSSPLPPDLPARLGMLLEKHDYLLNEQKVRWDAGPGASVHGLGWSRGGLTLSPDLVQRCAAQVRHRGALLQGGSEAERHSAAAALRGLDVFLRQFYEARGLTRPAELRFAAPRPDAPPAEHLDLLWP